MKWDFNDFKYIREHRVAPFAGAWIEICYTLKLDHSLLSLPSRERGLKSYGRSADYGQNQSLPSRERGLKLYQVGLENSQKFVAPFAGAWIEIP